MSTYISTRRITRRSCRFSDGIGLRRRESKMRSTSTQCKNADWENNWKQYYKPMEIGDRLLVVPEWLREDPKVRAGLAAGRVAWCWIRASPSAPAVMPPPACA